MKREILQKLTNWSQDSYRKPLILTGARQVGKTTSLLQFGQQAYQDLIYLNFEDEPHLKGLFETRIDPETVLEALSIEKNQVINPSTSLIIFDEVQECPNALISLKYFNEKANEYHICAAGSLLGVKLKNESGFPVGKVDFLELFPMSFFEFLDAISEHHLKSHLESIHELKPIASNLHEKLLHYFRLYLYLGGMPEVIANYADKNDLTRARTIQQAILKAYALDFAKHAPSDEIIKLNQVWNVIPSQLAKENKKFIYSVIRKGGRAKEFENAIQWLEEAGLVYKTYNISTPRIPLKSYINLDFFKLYLVDVGLLAAMVDLPANVLLQGNTLFQEFRGSFIENYAAQTLMRHYKGTYYWTSEGKAELDFILQHEGNNYPLEIKSGKSTKKKSLQVFAEKYKPNLLIRASTMNLRKDGQLLNCPLYLLEQLPHFFTLLRE